MAPIAPALPIIAAIGKAAAIGGAITSVVGSATGNKKMQRIGGIVGLAGAGTGLAAGAAGGALAAAGKTAGAMGSGNLTSSIASEAGSSLMSDSALSLSTASSAPQVGSGIASTISKLAPAAAGSAGSAAGSVGSGGLASSISQAASGTSSAATSTSAVSGLNAGINGSGISSASALNLSSETPTLSSGVSLGGSSSGTSGKAIMRGAVEGAKKTMPSSKVTEAATTVYTMTSGLEANRLQKNQLKAQQNYYNQQVATEKKAKTAAYTTAKQNRAKAAAYGYELSNYSTALNNLYSGAYSTTSGSAGVYTPKASGRYSLL